MFSLSDKSKMSAKFLFNTLKGIVSRKHRTFKHINCRNSVDLKGRWIRPSPSTAHFSDQLLNCDELSTVRSLGVKNVYDFYESAAVRRLI